MWIKSLSYIQILFCYLFDNFVTKRYFHITDILATVFIASFSFLGSMNQIIPSGFFSKKRIKEMTNTVNL